MQSGMSDFYDGMVIASMGGDVVGHVVVKYEDSTGAEHEERRELAFMVIDMNAGREMGGMGGFDGGGGMVFGPEGGRWDGSEDMMGDTGRSPLLAAFLRPIPLAVAGVVLVALIITTVALIRRRGKRMLEKELKSETDDINFWCRMCLRSRNILPPADVTGAITGWY